MSKQSSVSNHPLSQPDLALFGFLWKVEGWILHHSKQLSIGFATLLLVVISVQLLYPTNRTLPVAYLNSQAVGFRNKTEIKTKVSGLSNNKIQIKLSQTSYEPKLEELGISFTSDDKVVDYPFTARLLPFSFLFYGKDRLVSHVHSHLDQAKAKQYFSSLIDKNTKKVVEGSIKIENQKVVINYPQSGTSYSTDKVVTEVGKLNILNVNVFNVPADTTNPTYGKDTFNQTAAQAEAYFAKSVDVSAEGKTMTLTPDMIAQSIRFTPDNVSKTIIVSFDRMALLAKLTPLIEQLSVDPINTVVTTLDGNEIDRTIGSDGRAMANDTTIDNVIAAIKQSQTTATATVQPIGPSVITNRTYSKTSQGLQVLLNDWVGDNSGPHWSVSIKELSGLDRSATLKPDDQFLPASVYKLFLSYPLLTDVDDGTINLASPTSTGQSVDTCIEQMIVKSNNACAHALGDIVGWDNATSRIHAKGFNSTTLSMISGFTTTANDTTNILEQLYDGTLLPPAQASRLLNMMERQIYRTGIPAGSRGIVVADKPGYIDGYTHDVAIVFHPHGAYALSVFSTWGSYPRIANLATRLNNYFNQ